MVPRMDHPASQPSPVMELMMMMLLMLMLMLLLMMDSIPTAGRSP